MLYTKIFKLIFKKNDILNFQHLSNDSNKIHYDLQYSLKKTGSIPTVFGGLIVLQCMKKIRALVNSKIGSISATFQNSIVTDKKYNLVINFFVEKIICKITIGDKVYATIVFQIANIENKVTNKNKNNICVQEYSYNFQKSPLYYRYKKIMTIHDMMTINILCWISYYSGVVNPGSGSMLVDFEIHNLLKVKAGQTFKLFHENYDNRFDLYETEFNSGSVSIFIKSILHFLEYEKIALNKFSSKAFSKKNIFLTGASRGFGYKLKHVLGFLKGKIVSPTRNELDLTSNKSVTSYVAKNKELLHRQDIFVLNASGYFEAITFENSDIQDWLDELIEEVKLNIFFFHALLAVMKPEAHVIFISTDYINTLPTMHSSYILSKKISEEILLFCCHQKLIKNLTIFRPKKFLTSRTKKIFSNKQENTSISSIIEDLLKTYSENTNIK